MLKNFAYNEDGSMKTWVAFLSVFVIVFMIIGGLYCLLADNPPSDKILSQKYTTVLGKNLTLDDSLHYASYGFTKGATLNGVAKFKDVDLKKIDAKDLPREVKSQLSQSDVDLKVYVADVDESLTNGVTDVKHYVIIRHFNENNSDRLSGVYTAIKTKGSEPKVQSLEDAVNFTTAYLVTRGK